MLGRTVSTSAGVLLPVQFPPTLRLVATTLGERIVEAYKDAGLNRNQFAKRLGTVYHNVIRWEEGSVPGPEYLSKIASITGVTVDWLLHGGAKPTTTQRDDESSAALEQFLAAFDPDDRERPTDAEATWLRGLSFRELRLGGLEVTPSLLGRMLREKRLQDAGRISRGVPVEVAVDDTTLDLPDPPKRRR